MGGFRLFRNVKDQLDFKALDDDVTLRKEGGVLVGSTGGGGGGGAPTDATYLVASSDGDLSAEVVVGATPGGELGGTWASPTVDTTHSGSSHATVQSAAEATAAAALSSHEGDTTNIHGIADTSALDTTAARQSAISGLSSVYQPLDSDLTSIAALTTTSFGRALLALADAAALRTAGGLGTAATSASTDFQPIDSDLTAIAALTTTSYGRAFLALADAAAGRTALGLGTLATASAIAASDITSGTIAQARLGTGSGGAGTKVLYDDQTYKTPAAGSLTSDSAVLGAPVSINTSTFTDLLSLSLAAGTWIVMFTGLAESTLGGSTGVEVKLWDGTNLFGSSDCVLTSGPGHRYSLAITAKVVLGSTTTVKVSSKSVVQAAKIASSTTTAVTASATQLTAVKVA